jgi:capsular polysaccharide biosynthesis protein
MSLPEEQSVVERKDVSLRDAVERQEKILLELLSVVKRIEHHLNSDILNMSQINKATSEDLKKDEVLAPPIIDIWLPFNDIEPPVLLTKSSALVDTAETPTELLGRLRGSLIGRIYLKYLKKNKTVRLAVLLLWRNGIPVYYKYKSLIFGSKKDNKAYPLIKLSAYDESTKNIIASDDVLDTPAPQIFPQKLQKLDIPHQYYIFPDIALSQIFNALVTGGTNIIFTDDSAICHDLYDFSTDYTSEELHGRIVINPQKNQVRCLQQSVIIGTVPIAASFVDGCASNYAHWMTEVLPKICLFCADKRFKTVPLIINADLHPNLMTSVAMLAGDREVITLILGARIQVKELWLVSQTGYVPFDWRVKKLNNYSHGLFSPYALRTLKSNLLPMVDLLSTEELPKKIYLRRKSGGRKVTNGAEIEAVLLLQGFVVIEPERLSFAQQVALFASVDIIVGASGAAFANIIFCKPLTKIIILIPEYADTSFWYWQNIALASGNNVVSYVLGQIDEQADFGIHSDFSIKVSDLVSATSFSEN